MENEVTIFFDSPKLFEASNIKPLKGLAGLYFIFSQSVDIQYPFDKSKLLCFGVSVSKQIVLVFKICYLDSIFK